MRAVDLIRQKRDGGALDRDAIEFFVAGVTDGSLPDYQAAALLMAIVLRGMSADEPPWSIPACRWSIPVCRGRRSTSIVLAASATRRRSCSRRSRRRVARTCR